MSWIVWANVSLGEAWSRVQHNSSPRIPAERHNAKAHEVERISASWELLGPVLDDDARSLAERFARARERASSRAVGLT